MRVLFAGSLRHHARRYVATIVAITIAVAFVAAALVFGGSLNQGVKDKVAGQYNGVTAVVRGGPTDGSWTLRDLQAKVAGLESVKATYIQQSSFNQVKRAGTGDMYMSSALIRSPEMGGLQLIEGSLPSKGSDAVISKDASERVGAKVGDTVTLFQDQWACNKDGCPESPRPSVPVNLTITGISKKGAGDTAFQVTDLFVTDGAMDQLSPDWQGNELLIATADPNPSKEQQQEFTNNLAAVMKANGFCGAQIETAYKVVDEQMKMLNTDQAALTTMLLVFPVISSIVALIVVGTTFQVIFRQRERELALLRTIGATGKQVRRLMLIESATVGLVGAILGAVIGIFGGAAIAKLVGVVQTYKSGLISVSPRAILITVLVGTVFTLLAGFRPAVRASRVPPIQALAGETQSVQAVTTKRKATAIVSAIVMVALGIFTWILASGPEDQKEETFAQVLLLAVLTAAAVIVFVAAVLPMITKALGKLGRKESFRLAATNTARNPGRTASTGIAIFIGVTLIALVTVGAQSMRESAKFAMDSSAPIDLMVESGPTGFTDKQLKELAALKGIESSAVVNGTHVNATLVSSDAPWNGTLLDTTGTQDAVRGTLPKVGPGQVSLPFVGAEGPETVRLCDDNNECHEVQGIPTADFPGGAWMMAPNETFEQLGLHAEPVQVWIKLQNPEKYQNILASIGDIAPDSTTGGFVNVRTSIDQIINILVMVVVALLAVSVLVALVGITNTLSLSVAERTRENGLLRALGMTKKEMRSMLGWEALLIGTVSTVAGLIAGAYFGVTGFNSLPIGMSDRIIAIPWFQWALIVIVAIAAAMLASVVPGRRAARVSPTEALASE